MAQLPGRLKEADAVVNAVAAAFSLYLLATSLTFLPFVILTFIAAVAVSAMMAGSLALLSLASGDQGMSVLGHWQSYITLLKEIAFLFSALMMAFALVAGPVVVFISCLRKKWVRLAISATAFAAIQFLTLEFIASRWDNDEPARTASEQLQSTNLYPFIKSGVYVYLAFTGFAVARLVWRRGHSGV